MGEESHLSEANMEDTFSLGDDHMGKGSPEKIEPCESPIAKKRRVKFIERIDDRVFKFMNWYKSSNSELIRIPTSTEVHDLDVLAHEYWFEELLTEKGHLHELHVQAYVNLLKRRMAAQPDAFRHGSLVLHHDFANAMAEGSLHHPTMYAHVWKPHTTTYTIWRIESDHWVAVEMSLKDWTMHVYDSLDGYENEDVILKHLDGWAHYMRIVLQAAPRVQELPQMLDASEPPFKIDFLTDLKLPHMKGRGDCAVYALKYIEEMVTVGHIRRVSDEGMMRFRRQISADLYCQYFGD